VARSWLFQNNPNRFDIDGFLATQPTRTAWIVSRYRNEIGPGDQVFLWRAIGGGNEVDSGIVAEGEVLTRPALIKEHPSEHQFWRDPTEADETTDRVLLRIVRIADGRSVIRRTWLKDDPVLRDLLILRMANGTNYKLSGEEAARLNALWAKTSLDWTYAEAVAGLWAYHRTRNQAVSRLPGSPVADVALLIGRAIPGVYNKVMNFRALDPRDSRAGMSAVSMKDRQVWAEFYDPTTAAIRDEALEKEFHRLWDGGKVGGKADLAQAADQLLEREIKGLVGLELDQLMALFEAGAAHREPKPRARAVQAIGFDRDAVVAAIAKRRADFRCEVPDCASPVFVTGEGLTYCEVHHIRPLADGGTDMPDNVACLCALHHREAHYGMWAAELQQVLARLRLE